MTTKNNDTDNDDNEKDCVCVLTDLSVQLNTGNYTLARFFKRVKVESKKRQTDEHHTKKRDDKRVEKEEQISKTVLRN